MLNLDQETLQGALKQLEQAIYNHAQWHKALVRTLVCRLPGNEDDLAEDAHRRCRFGQWYYSDAARTLREHPAFAVIGREHERMHRAAARLLRATAAQEPIGTEDYEAFVTRVDRLRLEVNAVKHEIELALSNRDPLTGAHSRVVMLAELRELHQLARRRVQICALAFMDLDRFKAINDNLGHRVGDQVLAGAVRYVCRHLRPFDRIFRYGGEEFLITMPGADLAAARAIVERIGAGLGKIALAHDGSAAVHATASFGLAVLDPDVPVEESIHRADKAMYRAKAAGRDRACEWIP